MKDLIKNNINIKIEKQYPVNGGGGSWWLQNDYVDNYAWLSKCMSDQEIQSIIDIGTDCNIEKASIVGMQNDEIRNSGTSFIFPNAHTSWLFAKITDMVNEINSHFFKFDLQALGQGLQYTEYRAPTQHYSWHIDKGVGVRKLSMSIQLSDPDEYEGGDLEILIGGDPIKLKKEKGTAFFFPSYVLHRVTPVTAGTRKSLVCWVSGPPFR